MGTVSEDRADGLECCHSVGFLLFEAADLTFRVSGVDYMAFLKNYPIPQEVKGMADGESLRQLFLISGLTFACARGIVWCLPFEHRCRACVSIAGGFGMFLPAFFVFGGLFDFLTAFRIYTHGKRGIRVRV